MRDVRIRLATRADAERMRTVYAPYVQDTAISFEYDVPSAEEFGLRVERTLRRYPWLLVEDEGGDCLGYAYASPLIDRRAYDWVCEVSLYVRQDVRGRGLGRRLYSELADVLASQGVVTLYSCVAVPREEDDRLTEASLRFHERVGFCVIGRFERSGFKFGTWYDMVWMERGIQERPKSPRPFVPLPELRACGGPALS